jgi:hypothetical protein
MFFFFHPFIAVTALKYPALDGIWLIPSGTGGRFVAAVNKCFSRCQELFRPRQAGINRLA